ncbi:MAG: N-acetylmuramoyl-L-alanine amidase [Paracoccus sp. (in: a-proteobacteria)]|nr:N-acetylmuramoyl-L-alanine amidase [Paracoccus sp. (in: a-proteobacteria)]
MRLFRLGGLALWLAVVLALLMAAFPLHAQEKSALARLEIKHSLLKPEGRDRGRPRPLDLTLAITQPVPWRAYLIASPPRLVVDFRELDFAGQQPDAMKGADVVPAIRWGRFRQGWSRMVVELGAPYELVTAEQRTGEDGGLPQITLRLEPVAPDAFHPRGGDALAALWDTPAPAATWPLIARQDGSRPLRVTLDPGHGGIDPGAQAGGHSEAVLMLTFARELSEALMREGVEVTLTRREDVFVPLERRMTTARTSGADLLISLHADALPSGAAAGATIDLWNPRANDRAARELAMLHDRDDLLAGLDLQGTDDEVAGVLMELARQETIPRSEAFAQALERQLFDGGIEMHKRPVQGAAFSVLKSPDIPSVLLELGFLTDDRDRANLTDPLWRAQMIGAISRAIIGWARDDAARAALLRQ